MTDEQPEVTIRDLTDEEMDQEIIDIAAERERRRQEKLKAESWICAECGSQLTGVEIHDPEMVKCPNCGRERTYLPIKEAIT